MGMETTQFQYAIRVDFCHYLVNFLTKFLKIVVCSLFVPLSKLKLMGEAGSTTHALLVGYMKEK